MSGPTDATERQHLDHIFGDPTYTPPGTWYLCLSTTTPADDGTNFTEPGIGGYQRIPTTASDWDAATGSAPATKSNGNPLSFPLATGAQGTFTHFGLALSATPGTADIRYFGALGSSVAITLANQYVRFAAGALVLKTGDPSDSY